MGVICNENMYLQEAYSAVQEVMWRVGEDGFWREGARGV